jgi:hypothetical protein
MTLLFSKNKLFSLPFKITALNVLILIKMSILKFDGLTTKPTMTWLEKAYNITQFVIMDGFERREILDEKLFQS